MINEYKSPAAFRAALEQRQKQRATREGVPFDRLAQIDLYFRFLERIVRELGNGAVVLKGGLALELRLQRARTTLDVDLRALGTPSEVYKHVRAAGLRDHGDFLSFLVAEPTREIEGEGVIYEGQRFTVQARLANKNYRNPFGLDVAFGDPMIGVPEKMTAPDALSFMGISPPEIPIYPLGTHLAEKLHAYTLPRSRPNSRMKDLIDIALVAIEPSLRPSPLIRAASLGEAFAKTFGARKTHELPRLVPPPPEEWQARYPQEQTNNRLPWETLEEVHAEARSFLEPILMETAAGLWDPTSRAWLPEPSSGTIA